MHRKIILTYKNEEGNLEEESLWGEKTGKDQYKIANIAFFAPNIAWEDIVQVEEDNGNLYFDKLLQASGNSTLQIIFFTHDYGDILKELEKMGCQWEGLTNKTYISLNIPREISYRPIKEYLEKLRHKNILDYKEACLSHKN